MFTMFMCVDMYAYINDTQSENACRAQLWRDCVTVLMPHDSYSPTRKADHNGSAHLRLIRRFVRPKERTNTTRGWASCHDCVRLFVFFIPWYFKYIFMNEWNRKKFNWQTMMNSWFLFIISNISLLNYSIILILLFFDRSFYIFCITLFFKDVLDCA